MRKLTLTTLALAMLAACGNPRVSGPVGEQPQVLNQSAVGGPLLGRLF
jgi:hypothetical protein